MITNANPGNGNTNISLQGGFWDANNKGNPRGEDHKPFSYSGVAINFTNVQGLKISGLTVHNPESFFIRIGEVRDFTVEDINLNADNTRPNNDGVHVGGFSENGVIRNIKAIGAEVPNDDIVALNADDDVERQLNLGMRRGPIRNILVEDIAAEDAYTFVRMLSVNNPIEGITIRRIKGNCRVNGINLNNWRFPKGVGQIRKILLEDIEISKTEILHKTKDIIRVSLHIDDVTIKNLRRCGDTPEEVNTLNIDNNQNLEIKQNGKMNMINTESGYTQEQGDIQEMSIKDRGIQQK